MIYILTPHMSDFRRSCEENNLPYVNGRSRHDVVWVNHAHRLFGRAIYRTDTIIRGREFYGFDPKMLDAIEREIEFRQNLKR